MSVSQRTQCLFCSLVRSSRHSIPLRRQLHSSTIRSERQRPKPPKAGDDKSVNLGRDHIRNLTEQEIRNNFSAKQAEAIRAAQRSQISEHKDRTLQDGGPWKLDYFDDFTQVDPVVDKPVKSPWKNIDDSLRLKTEEEFTEDLQKFMQNLPVNEDAAEEAWFKFQQNLRLTVGKEEAERSPRSASAPDIPQIERPVQEHAEAKKTSQTRPKKDDGEQVSPALVRLMQMTGFDQEQLRRLRVKTIITHQVANQTRLGKIRRHYFLSIAGNGQGLIGIGEGKSDEPNESRIQSHYRAIRNMQPIMRYEKRTIFGNVKGKSGATELELYARPPGFGLRCQQYIWEIAKCAGISDLAARVTRARNPMNTVKATVQALLSQKDPEDIARARGKKLVDVRKVYYAGNL